MSHISLLSIFSLSQDDLSEELLAKFKRNPVLENITEYLVEEASAEEEVLLGASADPISLDNGDKDNMTDITFEKDDELNRVSLCAQWRKYRIAKLIPGKFYLFFYLCRTLIMALTAVHKSTRVHHQV